jgi:hypothetical protein
MRRRDKRDRFEKRLDSERPQPPDEFVSALADRLATERVRRGAGWRTAFAVGFTAALVAAFAATGSIGYAANAVKGGTSAVTTLVAGSSKADKTAKKADKAATKADNASSKQTNASGGPSAASSQGVKSSSARNQYQEKVLICHIPPGNPENAHTISVAAAAVPAHLAHGDTLGPCPNGN